MGDAARVDLDAIAKRRAMRPPHAGPVHPGPVITYAERAALVAAAEWAKGAPHHRGCRWHPILAGPCTCGRDYVLAPFGDLA